MKHGIQVALAIAMLVAVAHAQAPPPPQLVDFAGTFKAEFHKQTWLVLTLFATGKTLTGTLMHSIEIGSDDEGDITRVGDEMSSDAVVQVELNSDVLQITTRDEDGSEDHYTLILTGKDTAELQPVVRNGAAAPKAFKLKRNASPTK